jgi:hypothetical protein
MSNPCTDPKTELEPPQCDCLEGCDGSHKHRWEIEPHPDTTDFDVFVCDDDMHALESLRAVAEKVFDDMEPGQERTIKIRMNAT